MLEVGLKPQLALDLLIRTVYPRQVSQYRIMDSMLHAMATDHRLERN